LRYKSLLKNEIYKYKMKENTYQIYIEIERHSNIKYEYNKNTNKIELDRILPYPYFYPYSYGFFQNTKGNDGDELDALLITDKKYNLNDIVDCKIIGGLIMEDEKGMDEKIFVVPLDDNYFSDLSTEKKNEVYEDIKWFFTNYKTKDVHKWSKVYNFIDEKEAIKIYQESTNNYLFSS